ncbi:MAG: hypothetical protein J07HX64_00828 [halophilic archaeon J07HX64]|jgi:hypothetical protein|nr:MAG: hypothetical protein J07HX64_00828 [halophilic archaeon J07HX64]
MDARTRYTPTTRPLDTDETYTLRGLLTYAATVPAFVALLTAPGVVLALALGALTALVLDRALGLV